MYTRLYTAQNRYTQFPPQKKTLFTFIFSFIVVVLKVILWSAERSFPLFVSLLLFRVVITSSLSLFFISFSIFSYLIAAPIILHHIPLYLFMMMVCSGEYRGANEHKQIIIYVKKVFSSCLQWEKYSLGFISSKVNNLWISTSCTTITHKHTYIYLCI